MIKKKGSWWFGNNEELQALQQEIAESRKREIRYLQELTSRDPKEKYLFSTKEYVTIPEIQARFYELIADNQPETAKAGLPKELRIIQHRLAHYIDDVLRRYDFADKDHPPLSQMTKLFDELQILDTEKSKYRQVYAGLQQSVIAVSGGKIHMAAKIEFDLKRNPASAGLAFLQMVASKELYRKMQLRRKLLDDTELVKKPAS